MSAETARQNPADAYFAAVRPKIQHACNLRLLDFLAAFPRKRVRRHVGGEYFELMADWGDFYLPVNPSAANEPPFPSSAEQREFYQLFDGLRESAPGHSGHFLRASEIERFEFTDPVFNGLPVVFRTAAGDPLLMNSQGNFYWWSHEGDGFKLCAMTFSDLIEQYVEYSSVGDGHPFDFYGRHRPMLDEE